jgi:hypothetical protein
MLRSQIKKQKEKTAYDRLPNYLKRKVDEEMQIAEAIYGGGEPSRRKTKELQEEMYALEDDLRRHGGLKVMPDGAPPVWESHYINVNQAGVNSAERAFQRIQDIRYELGMETLTGASWEEYYASGSPDPQPANNNQQPPANNNQPPPSTGKKDVEFDEEGWNNLANQIIEGDTTKLNEVYETQKTNKYNELPPLVKVVLNKHGFTKAGKGPPGDPVEMQTWSSWRKKRWGQEYTRNNSVTSQQRTALRKWAKDKTGTIPLPDFVNQ